MENARKVYEVFLKQGREEDVARRNAEAWVRGNYGVEVKLAETVVVSGRAVPTVDDLFDEIRKYGADLSKAENLYRAWTGAVPR